ncbi:TetR/AcrR family transcriptional regulator [Kibdelosporangium persicum]|uniref:DNA-binding transcriptional regulator, AcrR family n=1 Tax=Kibdelosporangium persicum TaxID=2698649 RepID=A0ABX2EYM8_9PSEU|nr:TetR/AcrR family transcriptional regulator [Kibdelosporangium persicum]NRN64150.1 DNA-binding transcriptional regulator, AcrR family [Kibdelosporangium persicum]
MTVRRRPDVTGAGECDEARRPGKGDLTSQAILDTAERLLAERSLREIGIDELAAGAGVSRSTFYFHFESRDAVLYALSERVLREIYASGSVWFRRSDEPPGVAVRRALTAAVALWRKHGPVMRATVRGRETDPRLAELWEEAARRFVRSTAVQIESERRAGLALPGPPSARALARVLVLMNENTCYHQSMAASSDLWDAEIVDALTTIWLRSIYGPAVD